MVFVLVFSAICFWGQLVKPWAKGLMDFKGSTNAALWGLWDTRPWKLEAANPHPDSCLTASFTVPVSEGPQLWLQVTCHRAFRTAPLSSSRWFHVIARKGLLLFWVDPPLQAPLHKSKKKPNSAVSLAGWGCACSKAVMPFFVWKGDWAQYFKWKSAQSHAEMLFLLLIYGLFSDSSSLSVPFVLELSSRWMAQRASPN